MTTYGLYESFSTKADSIDEACNRLEIMAHDAPRLGVVVNYQQLRGGLREQLQYLDTAACLGMKIIISLKDVPRDTLNIMEYAASLAKDLQAKDKSDLVEKFIRKIALHEGLWGYYVGDEAEPYLMEGIHFSQLVQLLDSHHPRLYDTGVEITHDLELFANHAEVLCQHMYPIGRDADWPKNSTQKGMRALGAVAKNIQSIADSYRKKSGIVLQGHHFGQITSKAYERMSRENNGRFPSLAELQYMRDIVFQHMNPELLLFFAFHYVYNADLRAMVGVTTDEPWKNIAKLMQ